MGKENCWTCGKLTEIKPRRWPSFEEYMKWNDIDGFRQDRFSAERKFDASYDRVFCDECFDAYCEKRKQDLKEYSKYRSMVMYERALRYMERSKTIFVNDYREAAEAVLEKQLNDFSFGSSYEMIAAMVLIDERYKIKPQAKVGKYHVDFLIPELKVVLEIDGHMHKYNKKQDSKRDQDIRQLLPGWNIVRIKTKYIERNPSMLLQAIRGILKDRKSPKLYCKLYDEEC
jgi:very-short-patch-repair endonuclease